ncbi:MAG: recombination protein O N-terminal domain-containing protein [Patescibacteria group bacterium]
MYLRDRVVILKKQPFREQDRRLWMYGREHGALSVVARGASSRTSKQVGHLEPLTIADVMIAKGVAYDTLAVAQRVACSTQQVAEAGILAAYVIGGAFADLVITLTRPGIADERIFFLLCAVFDALSSMPHEPSPERARFLFAVATLKLLDLIGFAPDARSSLLAFIRHAPFADALRVTAPCTVLAAASACIEEALQHTPLEKEPHGMKTIAALLGV